MKRNNPVIELVLCVFLGYFGAHKFYVGKKGMGIVYLLTIGLFGFGWIFDIVTISLKVFKEYKVNSASRNYSYSNGDLQIETFRAAGVSYYERNIHKLAQSNPDWKRTAAQIISDGKAEERIYRYYFINKPVKLVHEPDNQHDKYAVAIYIAGELVGYISREDNRHVLDILNKRDVKYISGFIGGGEYKIIHADKEISRFEDNISVSIKIGYSK